MWSPIKDLKRLFSGKAETVQAPVALEALRPENPSLSVKAEPVREAVQLLIALESLRPESLPHAKVLWGAGFKIFRGGRDKFSISTPLAQSEIKDNPEKQAIIKALEHFELPYAFISSDRYNYKMQEILAVQFRARAPDGTVIEEKATLDAAYERHVSEILRMCAILLQNPDIASDENKIFRYNMRLISAEIPSLNKPEIEIYAPHGP